MTFRSVEPRVRLTKAFSTPYQNIVATARTCYSSKGIIEDSQVGDQQRFAPLARSIYEAGHHTTFQHAHFQFSLENVSRQFIWSFLHAHPYYNSEQVSQRYVTVKPETVVVPDLPADQLAVYQETLDYTFAAYQKLCQDLEAPVRQEFFKRFNPSSRQEKKHQQAIEKKAQEVARYVLPLATMAYLYHTISGITLLRYYRICQQQDVSTEQRLVVEKMVQALLDHDPNYKLTLEEPLSPEEISQWGSSQQPTPNNVAFLKEFDESLEGKTSRLVAWNPNGEQLLACAVREVFGLCKNQMSDEEAIRTVLDPAKNGLLGEALNLTTLDKASRALYHLHFTFRKKISHAADSQDQRHRMTPASRPILSAHFSDTPDFITPELIKVDEKVHSYYKEVMEQIWDRLGKLRRLGANDETLQYLLPNAVSVRFTESSDLLNLHHKHRMRLCYNAQEEIWKASVDEASQIRDVLPGIGKWLLPPCGVRSLAKQKPICPEGPRYCGVRVWTQDLKDYERVI
jgi:flavin-dependent thymidylate synthase